MMMLLCAMMYMYELDLWLLILTFDLYINIFVVNLTPSAGIAASWASAGSEGIDRSWLSCRRL